MKRLPIVAVSAFLLITVIVLGQTWWPEGSRPLQGDNQTKSTIKVNQILYDSQQGTKPLAVSSVPGPGTTNVNALVTNDVTVVQKNSQRSVTNVVAVTNLYVSVIPFQTNFSMTGTPFAMFAAGIKIGSITVQGSLAGRTANTNSVFLQTQSGITNAYEIKPGESFIWTALPGTYFPGNVFVIDGTNANVTVSITPIP